MDLKKPKTQLKKLLSKGVKKEKEKKPKNPKNQTDTETDDALQICQTKQEKIEDYVRQTKFSTGIDVPSFQKKDFDPESIATQIWNRYSEEISNNIYESVRFPPYFEKNNRTMSGNLIIFGVTHLTVFNLGNLSREIVRMYP